MSIRVAVRYLFGKKTEMTEDVAFDTFEGAAVYAMMNPGNRGVYVAITDDSEDLESKAREFFLRDAVKFRMGEYVRVHKHSAGQREARRIIDVVLTEEDIQNEINSRFKQDKKMQKFVIGIKPLKSDTAHVISGNAGWGRALAMAFKNPGHSYLVELDVDDREILRIAQNIQDAMVKAVNSGTLPYYDLESIKLDGTSPIDPMTMTVLTLGPIKTPEPVTEPEPAPEGHSVITHTTLKTGDPAFNQEEMSVTAATGAQRSKDADDYAYHLFHPCVMDRLAEVIGDGDEDWFAPASLEERLDNAIDKIIRWLSGDDQRPWLEHAALHVLLAMESQESGKTAALDPRFKEVYDSLAWGYMLFPPLALARIAKVWRTGANRYGAHNYERGMFAVECLNHGLKHIYDHIALALYNKETGCDDLAHVVCNLFMASQSWEFHPELNRGTRRGEGSTLTSDILAKQEAFNFLKRHREAFESHWDGLRRSDLTVEEKLKCCLSEYVPAKATRAGIEEVVRARLFEESRVG